MIRFDADWITGDHQHVVVVERITGEIDVPVAV